MSLAIHVPSYFSLFHSCIYLIDPSSVVPAAARRRLFSVMSRAKAAQNPDETPPLTDDDGDSDIDSDHKPTRLTLSPAELRVIRRLAERVNVLPVVGRADSLTDDKLRAVKATIKRELYEADLGFGLFAPEPMKSPEPLLSKDNGVSTAGGEFIPDANGHGDASSAITEESSDDDSDDGIHTSRPIITLRTGRQSAPPRRSRSRSRLELSRGCAWTLVT